MTKDQLLSALWPESFVEEANLTVCVSGLRKALGEKRGEEQFIDTVPKKGYRFVASGRRSSRRSLPRQSTRRAYGGLRRLARPRHSLQPPSPDRKLRGILGPTFSPVRKLGTRFGRRKLGWGWPTKPRRHGSAIFIAVTVAVCIVATAIFSHSASSEANHGKGIYS